MKRGGGGSTLPGTAHSQNLNSGQSTNNNNLAQNSSPSGAVSSSGGTNSNALDSNSTSSAYQLEATNVTATLSNEAKPGATSTREGVNTSTQDLDDIIRSVPGAYTQIDQSQGTISINIRGMTGLGRVNTMIDGVPQTFYGSSEEQGRYHSDTGRISGTSAYGAAIDQNMLTGIDITRGTFSGGNGNALMGSANLRTIGVNDIVYKDNPFGILTKFQVGDNNLGHNYMGALAGKQNYENGGYIGAMFAYSGRKLSQGYTIGESNTVITPNGGLAFNPTNLTQRPINRLMKFEFAPDGVNSGVLSYRNYRNNLAGRRIFTDAFQANYRFNPESEWIDLNFLAAYTSAKQKYNENIKIMSTPIGNWHGRTGNKSVSFDINNAIYTQPFEGSAMSSRLGVNFLSNDYTKHVDGWNADFSNGSTDGSTDMENYFLYGFSPSGKQKLTTIYLDNSLSKGILTLDTNINYLFYELSTHRTAPCSPSNIYCEPKEPGFFKKTGGAFNASLMLSAEFHNLFTPFVSYARTHRVPNVQEIFYSGTYSSDSSPAQDISTGLKPELANTYQIGFSSFDQGLLTDNDNFGLKLSYYYSDIKDFIRNNSFDATNPPFIIYINDKATMQGVELETRYDMGFFYTKFSFTYQDTDKTNSYTEGNAMDTGHITMGHMQFSELPKTYGVLDTGIRLFEQKLVLGARGNYTGKAVALDGNCLGLDSNNNYQANCPGTNGEQYEVRTKELPANPIIWDFYASFAPIRNLEFKFEVQNAFNQEYVDPLSVYNSSAATRSNNAENWARGRTYIGGFVFRY